LYLRTGTSTYAMGWVSPLGIMGTREDAATLARALRDATTRGLARRDADDQLAADSDSATAWLDVTTPVDIEARMRDARLDYAAIMQIATSPALGARPQAARARAR
jgi:hypothetical protein